MPDPSLFTTYHSSERGATEFRTRDGRSVVLIGEEADRLRKQIDERRKQQEQLDLGAVLERAHQRATEPTVTERIDELDELTGRGGPVPPPSSASAAFARSAAVAGLDAAMAPVTLSARGLRALGVEHPLVREASELSGARAIEDATWIATGEDPAPYRARVERERADFPTATAAGEELGGLLGGLGTGAVQGRLTSRFVRQAGPVLHARSKAERTAIADDAINAARRLGVANMAFNRDPESMRDMTGIRRAYEGTTPDVADQIATGQRPPQGSVSGQPLPPVSVHVFPSEGVVALNDGRHRLQAAQEAGARNIRARVRVYGPRGGLIEEREEVLPIAGLQEQPAPKPRDPAERMNALAQTSYRHALREGDVGRAWSFWTRNPAFAERSAGAAEFLEQHPRFEAVRDLTYSSGALNKQLRGLAQGTSRWEDKRLATMGREAAEALEDAIRAGHVHEGPAYRGLNLPQAVLDEWLQRGAVTNASFLSATADPAYAAGAAVPNLKTEPAVIMRMTTRSAVPVTGISRLPHEQEVLIPPGRSWAIRGVSRDDRGRYVLDVEEADLPEGAAPAITFAGGGRLGAGLPSTLAAEYAHAERARREEEQHRQKVREVISVFQPVEEVVSWQ